MRIHIRLWYVVCGMCGAPLRAYGLELDRQWASQAGWLHGDPAHPVLDASLRLGSVSWSCSVWCVSCMLCASSRWMPYSTREWCCVYVYMGQLVGLVTMLMQLVAQSGTPFWYPVHMRGVSGSVPCPFAYDLLAAQYCVSAPHCPAPAAAACIWGSCCIVQQAMCPLAADSRVLIPLLGAVQFESRTVSAMDVNSC